MDDQPRDYAVGYGKPPVETRFQKGQSGNPEGRPRGTKKLVTLLAEVLSQRSGLPNPDGSWMTKAEAIFFSLATQASTPDLKAKKLLFDLMIKLQQTNICHPSDRLPEIQLDQNEGAHDAVAAEIDRLAAIMSCDAATPAQAPAQRTPDAQPPENATEAV